MPLYDVTVTRTEVSVYRVRAGSAYMAKRSAEKGFPGGELVSREETKWSATVKEVQPTARVVRVQRRERANAHP
jgi:hypothetical protein